MPNTVRTQPIWLPTGNPDTTNIVADDFTALGGQPGSLGQKFDFNDRVYQRVRFDSGTPGGGPAIAANQVLFWKDKDAYLVTNDSTQAIGGQTANGYRNFVAGILRNAATAGRYIDILKKGENLPIADGANTFALGETVIAEAGTAAAADRVAVGTAPTYQRLGVARAAAAGGNVNVDIDIDFEHQ